MISVIVLLKGLQAVWKTLLPHRGIQMVHDSW